MLPLPLAEEVAVKSSAEALDEYGAGIVDSVVGNGIVMVSDPVIAAVELTPSGISDEIWLANEVEAAEVSKEGARRVKLYPLS